MPCKPLPVRSYEENIEASERRHSNRRNLVPQPSPKIVQPSSVDNATTVQQPRREQRYTSLPPLATLGTTLPLSTSSQPMFRRGAPQNPQQIMEAMSTIPVSSSTNKVVHLSQIDAESFKKITKNEREYSQQHMLNVRSAGSSHQQRKTSDPAKSSSTGFTPSRTSPRPIEIPQSGLPYQPQKSPYTPRSYSINRSAHSFPVRPSAAGPNHPIPYLSSALITPAQVRVDSPSLQDTTDEISCSTHDQGHYAQAHQQQQNDNTERDSSKVSSSAATVKTPLPPSHSTIV